MCTSWRTASVMFAAWAVLAVPVRGEFQLRDNDRVVLFGDSALHEVRSTELLNQFLRTRYPESTALVCSLGEKRSTMQNAAHRFEQEVLPLRPTQVILCFGLDAPERKAFDAQRLEQHLTGLSALIDAIQAEKIAVALLTPPPPDESLSRGLARLKYDEVVGRYAEAIRKLGTDKKLPVIDWHTAVQDKLATFSGDTQPIWTRQGMVPAPYSLAVLTDLLLTHWQAEPLNYRVTADFTDDASIAATTGSAKVAGRGDTYLDLALTGVPVAISRAGAAGLPDGAWPMAKWFNYHLQIKGVPAGGVIISSDGKNAKPFLAQQLADENGADMSAIGPLAVNDAARQLHDAILRQCNQFSKYRLAADRVAPEPELVEGYRLLKEAEISMALATHQIACRTPARFDITLHIEIPKEMAKPQPSPAQEKP